MRLVLRLLGVVGVPVCSRHVTSQGIAETVVELRRPTATPVEQVTSFPPSHQRHAFSAAAPATGQTLSAILRTVTAHLVSTITRGSTLVSTARHSVRSASMELPSAAQLARLVRRSSVMLGTV